MLQLRILTLPAAAPREIHLIFRRVAALSVSSGPRTFAALSLLTVAAWLSLTTHATAEDTNERRISFNQDVRPILSENCFHCHGPDPENREADLRLDERNAVIEAGALQPNAPEESELIHRVFSDDADLVMPPPHSKRQLTKEQKETLRTWIAQGAAYQRHWSFEPIARNTPPDVEQVNWAKNEIDRFVLRRLLDAKLTPTKPASRERLIRRLSFDLTGLPPTTEEVDAFLADSGSDAYERLVDRLLASKRFGERMASEWLDVARYSDTYGYQVDRDRFVWPWRDWVVRAFNRNLPYDQFITEQLAGDLLPNATDDQILATTFNRLHPQKVEGGSTPEEFRIEYVADRTQTFATAFLGLTLECARCHDHKYDPLTQREYYQLTAYFDKIDEAGLYSYFTSSVPTPTLALSDNAAKDRLRKARQEVQETEAKYRAAINVRNDAFRKWLQGDRSRVSKAAPGSVASEGKPLETIPGRVEHLDFESSSVGGNERVKGRVGQAVKLTGDDGIGLKVGNFRRFEPFSVALWLQTPDAKSRAVVFHRSRAWTDAGSRGYQLLIEDGRLSASLIHFWPGNAIRVVSNDKLPLQSWVHVAVTYDGSSRADGLQLFIDGEPAEVQVVRDQLTKNVTGGGGNNITIGQRFRDRGFTNGMVDEFQVFNRRLSPPEVAHLHDGQSLTELLESPSEKLNEDDLTSLAEYYFATRDGAVAELRKALRASRERLSKIEDGLREIMVMREMKSPRTTYLLLRGAYDKRGDQLEAGTPASLPPFPNNVPRNRLGLARWLTSPDHPLTARVAVNRYWQMLFGEGLVRTPEDFGSQGKLPTHPDLLDWLAADFVRTGWNVKQLLKKIVMSATYRQDSTFTPALVARDPDNLLLARGPSYRLPAEMLRDQALSVSGLLTNRIGGAPAKPYEVEVSFKPTKRDAGEGLYRRSLYTYWKRTGPAPVMMSLDAAKRDVCRVRRERTSSPLQALVLMNGPQFVEASRVLGQRLLQQHKDDQAAMLRAMYRQLTGLQINDAELQILTQLFEAREAAFQENEPQRTALLAVGDAPVDSSLPPARLAAATVVANALMNLDSCVMKR